MKKYKFKCGVEAAQDELTYLQTKQLAKALKKINIGEVNDLTSLKMSDVLDRLLESDLAIEVIAVITRTDESKLQDLTISEIIEVFTDFFTINPGLKKLSPIGKLAAGMIPTADSAQGGSSIN